MKVDAHAKTHSFIVTMRWVIICLVPVMYGISLNSLYSYDKFGIMIFLTVTALLSAAHLRSISLKPLHWGIIHLADLSVVSLLVMSHGGIDSECNYLYFLIVLQAGLVFGVRSALLCLFFSTLSYSVLVAVPGLTEAEVRRLVVRIILTWLVGIAGAYLVYWEKKYRKQAQTDCVTSIYNRSYLEQSLKYEIKMAEDRKSLLSLIMIDIDNFKTINDRFGHRSGDMVLEQVADLIQANIRDIDFVARYGGEEFIVALPGTAQEQALEIAERIRHVIEYSDFSGTNHEGTINLTVSCGLAVYPIMAKSLEELMQKADEYLYEAKRAGRNQVYFKAG